MPTERIDESNSELNTLFDSWVLDVTNWPIKTFCPLDDGVPLTGLMVVQDECPGVLSGVIHMDGQEAVELWINNHPKEIEALS